MSIRTPDSKATTRSYPRLAKGTSWPGNLWENWQGTPKPPQTNLPPFGCQSQPQGPRVNRVGKAPRLFSGNRAKIKLLVRSLHTSTGAGLFLVSIQEILRKHLRVFLVLAFWNWVFVFSSWVLMFSNWVLMVKMNLKKSSFKNSFLQITTCNCLGIWIFFWWLVQNYWFFWFC